MCVTHFQFFFIYCIHLVCKIIFHRNSISWKLYLHKHPLSTQSPSNATSWSSFCLGTPQAFPLFFSFYRSFHFSQFFPHRCVSIDGFSLRFADSQRFESSFEKNFPSIYRRFESIYKKQSATIALHGLIPSRNSSYNESEHFIPSRNRRTIKFECEVAPQKFQNEVLFLPSTKWDRKGRAIYIYTANWKLALLAILGTIKNRFNCY